MARPSGEERRNKGRTKVALAMHVRPSSPHGDDFDELVETLNVSRYGLYFVTQRHSYHKEMRLFVTYPYSTKPGAINQEYVAKVTRIDHLADGNHGIAVELLTRIHLGTPETIKKV